MGHSGSTAPCRLRLQRGCAPPWTERRQVGRLRVAGCRRLPVVAVLGPAGRPRTTVVLTTQYLKEAERLGDDIIVVNKGRIIAWDRRLVRVPGTAMWAVRSCCPLTATSSRSVFVGGCEPGPGTVDRPPTALRTPDPLLIRHERWLRWAMQVQRERGTSASPWSPHRWRPVAKGLGSLLSHPSKYVGARHAIGHRTTDRPSR